MTILAIPITSNNSTTIFQYHPQIKEWAGFKLPIFTIAVDEDQNWEFISQQFDNPIKNTAMQSFYSTFESEIVDWIEMNCLLSF